MCPIPIRDRDIVDDEALSLFFTFHYDAFTKCAFFEFIIGNVQRAFPRRHASWHITTFLLCIDVFMRTRFIAFHFRFNWQLRQNRFRNCSMIFFVYDNLPGRYIIYMERGTIVGNYFGNPPKGTMNDRSQITAATNYIIDRLGPIKSPNLWNAFNYASENKSRNGKIVNANEFEDDARNGNVMWFGRRRITSSLSD